MATTGRPRALNEDKRKQVCGLVASGCGMDHAARHVGCSVRTIRREALRNPAFGEKLRRAELAAQLQPISAVRSAASKNWRAAAWLLERTQPRRVRPDATRPSLSTDSLSAAVDNLLEAHHRRGRRPRGPHARLPPHPRHLRPPQDRRK